MLQVFKNPDFGEIRTAGTADRPLFCLSDVCKAIGISNARNVKSRLDDDDVRLVDTIDKLGRTQQVTFVTESGLYDVIIRSDIEQAKQFRKWVTSEVLPSIRKSGGYIATTDQMTDDEIMARAINIAQDTIRKRDERIKQLEDEKHNLIEENTVMLPKVRAYEKVINTPQTQWLKTTQEVANEIGMSAQRLNAQLVAMQIIYKASNGEYLVTSNYANWGLHSIVSYPINDKRVKTYIKWTDRGRLYIRALHETNWNKRRAWHLIKKGKEVAEV